jgi:prepilin-type N-terminal cleavage/methylation domain-containing protein
MSRMNRNGQTLLEVMIAIGIIAVVVLGAMQALNVGILGVHRVDIHNIELNLARSQMNYIKAQDYITYNDSCQTEDGQSPYIAIDEIPQRYRISTTVCNVNGTDAEALQYASLRASYDGKPIAVELDGYKINPAVLPALYDLPLIETIEIPVPIMPGGNARTLGDGEFFVFYGYPFTFYIPREGAVAVTWIVDQAETYGTTNRMDVYLYQHAEDDAPFDDEFYDNRWDTTCFNCSVTDCFNDCRDAVNWSPLVPDFPRIVLMDDSYCRTEPNLALRTLCHDEELPQKREGTECGEPGSVCIAHDEVTYLGQDGYILTAVLMGGEIVPAGWYTVFFYNSNPVDPQTSMRYLYTVATDLASVSFYSRNP